MNHNQTDLDSIWEEDLLNRKAFSQDFEALLKDMVDLQQKKPEKEQETTIVALNAPFGSGKTYFLERWYQDLEKRHIPCAYFSAWETDFSQEPLVAFMHFMLSRIEQRYTDKNNKQLVKKVTDSLYKILKLGLHVGLHATGHSSLMPLLELIVNFYQKKEAKTSIERFQCILEERHAFQKALKELIHSACNSSTANEEKPFAFILIIDELERCKPTYAVELLEQLKHFLGNIPQLTVVLGIDHEQLKHTIQHHYGQNYDADGYLKRFFQDLVLLRQTDYAQLEDFYDDWPEKTSFDLLRPDLRSLKHYKNKKALLSSKFGSKSNPLPYDDDGFIKFLLLLKCTQPTFYNKMMKRLIDEDTFWTQVATWMNRNDLVNFKTPDEENVFKRYFLHMYFFTFRETGTLTIDDFKNLGNRLEQIGYTKNTETANANRNTGIAAKFINEVEQEYKIVRDKYKNHTIRELLHSIIEEQRWPID